MPSFFARTYQKWIFNVFRFLLLASVPGATMAHATIDDFVRLYNDLLQDYSLMTLLEVEEMKQLISVQAILSITWENEFLRWTPANYGDIKTMHFNQNQIWAPEVAINGKESMDDLRLQHTITSDGRVSFSSAGNLENNCMMDMTYFPFDEQTCLFSFNVLESTANDVVLIPSEAGKLKDYMEHGEWDVFSVDALPYNIDTRLNESFSSVNVMLKLRRRPTYYVFNIFLPVATISKLGLLTFLVPVESGERLTYTLTVLLSLTVYATYVSGLMPRSSLTTPIITQYLMSLFLINSICIFMTLAIISLRWGKVVHLGRGIKLLHIFGIPISVSTVDSIPAGAVGKKEKNNKIGNMNDGDRNGIVIVQPATQNIDTRAASSNMHSASQNNPSKLSRSLQNRGSSDAATVSEHIMLQNKQADPNKSMDLESTASNSVTGLDKDLKKVLDKINLTSFLLLYSSFFFVTVYMLVRMNEQ